MDDDFDFFADNGVRMMTIEGGNHWAANLLTYYVAAKKTWDIDVRAEAVVDDVCARFFGPAAAPMRRYFDIRAKAFRAAGPNERNGRKIKLDEHFDEMRALLDEAAAAVEGTRYTERVAFFQRYQGYLTIYYAAKRAVQSAQPDDTEALAAADAAIDTLEAYLNTLPEDGLVGLPSAKHYTLGWMRKDMRTKRAAAAKK
ncbi:MAG: DUF4838 domain-containing protein [bacterium]|nr:DUF4838 domain-containing protein [bacterium]